MFAPLLTCVLAFAAQEAPEGVAPALVIGLQSAEDASDDDEKKAKAREVDAAQSEADKSVQPPPMSTTPEQADPSAPATTTSPTPPDATAPKSKPAVPQTSEDSREETQGYTPLPEGKVLPPNDPPPKPVPPPLPDEDRPPAQGLSPPQFPALLTAPLQVISGVIAGIGMVPVTALTLGLGLCAGPAAITLAEVAFADLVGQRRGTLFWPTMGAYCTSASCSGLYAGSAGVVIALVVTGVITFAAISPALLISGALIAPLALFPVFAAGNIFATALAPAILYPFNSEPKNADDPSLHFPGFFSPNHRTPRLPPGTPTAAMKF